MQDRANHRFVVTRHDFSMLLATLRERGYLLLGPTLRDQAIVYDEINGAEDLPAGWTDEQEAGQYKVKRRDDNALFAYNVGPHSWKKFLQLPSLTLWKAQKTDNGFKVEERDEATPRMAFIGVRPCELRAIAVQDQVLTGGDHIDPDYARRRKHAFIVTVQCTQAGNTCFCVSMGTGPRAEEGFDLAVTEIIDTHRHEFVIEAGTDTGAEILARVPHRSASEADWQNAQSATQRTAEQMGRQIETSGIRELLYRNAEHPRWDEVADRCLACTNCTMVCPTCFCTAVEDVTDLAGQTAERIQRWDSCFNSRYSYIHGGIVRPSTRSRYRQWLTHKLAYWHDQFGSSGCVGCGRCISWCPAGIDITEEVAAIRANDGGGMEQGRKTNE
ncbi:MAG: 4Fe-4S dicluster domain-containing protein [Gammaproteobacteria bacterium]|nr:MAG: 4Fe-4S dicluster domain-containing protein [Gammaproteobacteria bacterium]